MSHEGHIQRRADPAAAARGGRRSSGHDGGPLAALQRAADRSPATRRLESLQQPGDGGQGPVQREAVEEESEELQMVRAIQRSEVEEESEELQMVRRTEPMRAPTRE